MSLKTLQSKNFGESPAHCESPQTQRFLQSHPGQKNSCEGRSKLEREIGAGILKECYLDELDPNRGRMSDEILIECNIFCMLNV